MLVTERIRPLRLRRDRAPDRHPLPLGRRGLSTGDSANDLLGVAMDANTHIQESKAATCDIRPGRRPRGEDLLTFVEGYRRRAGLIDGTG